MSQWHCLNEINRLIKVCKIISGMFQSFNVSVLIRQSENVILSGSQSNFKSATGMNSECISNRSFEFCIIRLMLPIILVSTFLCVLIFSCLCCPCFMLWLFCSFFIFCLLMKSTFSVLVLERAILCQLNFHFLMVVSTSLLETKERFKQTRTKQMFLARVPSQKWTVVKSWNVWQNSEQRH